MRGRTVLGFVLSLALLSPSLGAAQGGGSLNEVLVTASRIGADEDTETPHVVVVRRADNLVVSVVVTCDTRDAAARANELRDTVRNLLRDAERDPRIDVGLDDQESGLVAQFNEGLIASNTRPGGRPDTSTISFLIKTPITADDTFPVAKARMDAFVARVTKVGRSEVSVSGEYQLSLVEPRQYRTAIIKAIAADAQAAAAAFGTGYQARLTGLQRPLSWYRFGDLDLALFIPYTLEIAPPGQ